MSWRFCAYSQNLHINSLHLHDISRYNGLKIDILKNVDVIIINAIRAMNSNSITIAEKLPVKMPKGVTYRMIFLKDRKVYAYVFFHHFLGEIGKLVILPFGNKIKFLVEVEPGISQATTDKRNQILDSIAMDLFGVTKQISETHTEIIMEKSIMKKN